MSMQPSIPTLVLPLVPPQDESGSAIAPGTQEKPPLQRMFRRLIDRILADGVYMSADEVQRVRARVRGYRDVCQHPREIGSLDLLLVLVMDLNAVLNGDKAEAIRVALETARRGVPVGIHSYNLGDPDLDDLRTEPNIVLEKTHRRVLVELRQRFP